MTVGQSIGDLLDNARRGASRRETVCGHRYWTSPEDRGRLLVLGGSLVFFFGLVRGRGQVGETSDLNWVEGL